MITNTMCMHYSHALFDGHLVEEDVQLCKNGKSNSVWRDEWESTIEEV